MDFETLKTKLGDHIAEKLIYNADYEIFKQWANNILHRESRAIQVLNIQEVVISAPVVFCFSDDSYGWVYLFEHRPGQPEYEQIAESNILRLDEYKALL